jgi:diketogulonate reductase-like aldo/keto reductase
MTFVLGTYDKHDAILKESIRYALNNNIFNFDTAQLYQNEKQVAIHLYALIKEKNIQDKITVTTKIMNYPRNKHIMQQSINKSLNNFDKSLNFNLRILLHRPMNKIAWETLEENVKLGNISEIGVSNHSITDLKKLKEYYTIKPCVNQIELHPFLDQQELTDVITYCNQENIPIEAHSVFCKSQVFKSPAIYEIFLNSNLNKEKNLVDEIALNLVNFAFYKGATRVCVSSKVQERFKNFKVSLNSNICEQLSKLSLNEKLRVRLYRFNLSNYTYLPKCPEDLNKENLDLNLKEIKEQEIITYVTQVAKILKQDFETYTTNNYATKDLSLDLKNVDDAMFTISEVCLEVPNPRNSNSNSNSNNVDVTSNYMRRISTGIALQWLNLEDEFVKLGGKFSYTQRLEIKEDKKDKEEDKEVINKRKDLIHAAWKTYRKNLSKLTQIVKLRNTFRLPYQKLLKEYAKYSNKVCYLKVKNNKKSLGGDGVLSNNQENKISNFVINPTPMPVQTAPKEELEQFLNYISQLQEPPKVTQKFPRGVINDDGRLDVCKQVVGPEFIVELCNAVKKGHAVTHFLLGNNISFGSSNEFVFTGEEGNVQEENLEENKNKINKKIKINKNEVISANAVASLMRDKTQLIETYYLAGNMISSIGLKILCDALQDNTHVKAFWLKRNPLLPASGVYLAELLSKNKTIEVLDLNNTGLLDEGVINFCNYFVDNKTQSTSLKHIYLDTNGLTEKCSESLGKFLAIHKDILVSVFLSVNRLGDTGIRNVLKGLANSKSMKRFCCSSNGLTVLILDDVYKYCMTLNNLQMLDIGYFKNTLDMGEQRNNYSVNKVNNKDSLIAINNFSLLVEQHKKLKYINLYNTQLDITSYNIIKSKLQKDQIFIAQQYGVLKSDIDDVINCEKSVIQKLRNPRRVLDIASVYRNNM